MVPPKGNSGRKEGSNSLVAVAIDRDKNSQNAMKWAIDHVLQRGQTIILVHVKVKHSSAFSQSSSTSLASFSDPDDLNSSVCSDLDTSTKDLFLPFRCFCTRKDIQCKDVLLEDTEVSKALIEFTTRMTIDTLVLGTATKSSFLRFKTIDIPASVIKGAPEFCTVYVISKGKISLKRSSTRPPPAMSPLRQQLQLSNTRSTISENPYSQTLVKREAGDRPSFDQPRKSHDESDSFRSPFTRKGLNGEFYKEVPMSDTDISFVSSSRPSTERMFPSFYESESVSSKFSLSTDSFDSMQFGQKSQEMASPNGMSSLAENGRLSTSQQSFTQEDQDNEMRQLKLELKQTMELYSACKEALTAKQKALELQRSKLEEVQKAKEVATILDEEKAKSIAAVGNAEEAERIAELDARKRQCTELKELEDGDEKKRTPAVMADIRYRRYSIEEIETATEFFADSLKVGEGGYGPVYKCYLDHTPVAIKVLRPDAAQGRSQFNQEVEVLSCIRHPNMVLLLGACPEYGCLVYEFMANGSLEDRLFRLGNSPPLSWQLRFKIAAEIGTGLLFLHNTKPEPLVHRDLKPGNILIDRNFVSKISDVGLARLVPPSVADTVTQYLMTSTAGTFCYIDPEYQQTGMLGVKSDIYSLGIIFLQLLTARPPMGLSHHVERAIEKGTFREMLDPAVPDWPYEDALGLAKLSLRCSELRRKDRPDLGKVVLPELDRLRTLAEDSLYSMMYRGGPACLTINMQSGSKNVPSQMNADE